MDLVAARLRAALTALEPPSRPLRVRTRRDGGTVTVSSAWTDVHGLRMHARVALAAAPDGARDVVLVHGLVVSSRYMLPLVFELARDFRVHAPDLPGFGLSEAPAEPLDVARLAEALVAWLDRRRIDRAVLVGNSLGCQVAAEAMVRRPERFEAAVLQGPTSPAAGRAPVRYVARWLRAGAREPVSLNALIARDYLDCGVLTALATARSGFSHPFDQRLRSVRAPALVVRGGADTITSQRWAEQVAAALPHGKAVVLPGVAHTLNFSAAPQLAAVIRRFLGLPSRRRPARPRSPTRSIASFDSATVILRACSRALRGRGIEAVGAVPSSIAPLAELAVQPLNRLPASAREAVYRRSSGIEGIPPERLHTVSAEAIAEWMAGCYPRRRRYPAAIVGSASGALAHLAAALAIPFLPQTVLIPVRQAEVDPDDPAHGLELGRGPAELLLDANPELQLHHMHDPNQDRLTLARVAYFRVKRRRLGEALERFLRESLSPGATLFVADCRLRWPVTRVGERHVFQLGALGGIGAGEFRRRWDGPTPDSEAPEAEWGFEPQLDSDLRELAEKRGLRLRRICFDDPEDLSPPVAELHRWWYRRRGYAVRRLLVESFMLLDPWWAIRTGSVPYWSKFAVESSAAKLERYLAAAEPYEETRLTLFSHGTEGAGVAPVERWREVMRRGGGRHAFLGVDPDEFPRDFASFGRFDRELRALAAPPGPVPPALTLAELDRFLDERGADEGVAWLDG